LEVSILLLLVGGSFASSDVKYYNAFTNICNIYLQLFKDIFIS